MATKPQARSTSGRELRSVKTRAAILAAAERIFAEVGLAGARIDAIAAAAGVNKALLYYYFRSKDALFRAVLENHMKAFYAQALKVLLAGGSSGDIVKRYVSAHFDFISARPYYPRLFQRLIMTGGRTLERLARKYFVPLGRRLTKVIEQGVRDGEFRCCHSQHTVISLVALTVFYFSVAPLVRLVSDFDPYAPANLTRRKEEVLNFIRYGLFRDPETRLP